MVSKQTILNAFINTGNLIESQDDVLITTGKLVYKESTRAWCIIRLKHEFIKYFPKLLDVKKRASYKILYPKNQEVLEDFIKQVKEEGKRPLLLYFFEDEELSK